MRNRGPGELRQRLAALAGSFRKLSRPCEPFPRLLDRKKPVAELP